MRPSLEELLVQHGLPFQRQVSMAAKTTLRVGGPAQWWISARNEQDILTALRLAEQTGVGVYIVGQGSNLLVCDDGVSGLVVGLSDGMTGIDIDGETVRAQAGVRLAQVGLAAQAAGLSGWEALCGVPGTVGGAICMNAGCYGTEIAELTQAVRIVDREGNARWLSGGEMDFSYRHSILMDHGWIATEAVFVLTRGEADAIAARMREYARQRREKQPLSMPSAGSFFKRPAGHYAAALIDQAGLKGLSVGGAQVSMLHAGFLVNTGGATASDFLALMELVQRRVWEKSGVRLEPEVRIIGKEAPAPQGM